MVCTIGVAGFALFFGMSISDLQTLDCVTKMNCYFRIAAENKHVAYGALYLMVPGVYARTPVISAWMSNNSEPYYRRATSIAMGFFATGSGGILSTWLYPSNKAPKFRTTTIMNLVL
jgi:hypothetical protein